jgi:hypothetical protein
MLSSVICDSAMAKRLVAGIASAVAHCYDAGENRGTLRILRSLSF